MLALDPDPLTFSVAGSGPAGFRHVAWITLYPVYDHWLAADVVGALEELQGIASRAHPRYAPWIARAYLTLGRLAEAERIFASLPRDTPHYHEGLALVALARGDRQALRNHLAALVESGPQHNWVGVLQTREGLVSPDGPLNRSGERSPTATLLQATAVLREGGPDRAIALLEDVLPWFRDWAEEPAYLALQQLASAWEQKGDLDRAARALELTRDMKARAAFGRHYRPFFWLLLQADLARLHGTLGNQRRAREIEHEVAAHLAVADADHALRTQPGGHDRYP